MRNFSPLNQETVNNSCHHVTQFFSIGLPGYFRDNFLERITKIIVLLQGLIVVVS